MTTEDEGPVSKTHAHLKWRDMERQAAKSKADAARKRPAGVCAILFGGLGAHKFVLGYPLAGALMLLSTLLAAGFAPYLVALPVAIGIVEGVLYLRMSDADFIGTHVNSRRAWF